MSYSRILTAFCLVLICSRMLAGTDHAVFRSADRGRSWSRSDTGLPGNIRVNVFGAIGSVLLAGTERGIYVSRNQGLQWNAGAGAAVGSGRILSLATLGSTAYAGTDRGGILTSTDGGASWISNARVPFRYVRSLLAHAGMLYAGTDAQGVFVSRDGGSSWLAISRGLPGHAQIFSMEQSQGRVYAGLYGRGLYAWFSREQAWQRAGAVSPLVLASAGATLLAGHNPGGIRRSDDGGATWTPGQIAYSPDLGSAPVWELDAGPDLAIAGVANGIYYSEDRGRTWVRAQNGLPAKSAGIAFYAGGGFVLAAASIEHSR
ncbi:MAG: hypothetical protein SFV51_28600 [Bryobacteraceae bacterium]|nr:hypothetical protein [Bryobacteraceae bacterium]